MKYVVCYDIDDDQARGRVADVLLGFGQRVQESVFECTFDEGDLQATAARLTVELAKTENANLRFYRLCADCQAGSVGLGDLVETIDSRACLVV